MGAEYIIYGLVAFFFFNMPMAFDQRGEHLSSGEKQDDNLECLALPGFKSKYFLTFDILTVEQNFQTFI